MCRNEQEPRRPRVSGRTARERLAYVLVLVFIIVLLTAVFFPQSVARDALPYVAGALLVAIRAIYRTRQKDEQ